MGSASLKRDCQIIVSVSHVKAFFWRSNEAESVRKIDWPWSFSSVPSSGSKIPNK